MGPAGYVNAGRPAGLAHAVLQLDSGRSGPCAPGVLTGRLDVDDLVLRRAAGGGDHDLLPHLPLEYCPAHPGGVAEFPARRVRLVGADYLERPLLSLPADDPEGYPGTEVDRVFLDFRRVDNLHVAYPALELTDPALQQALFVLRLVVLGVLRDVPELTSLADAVGYLLATRLGQVCEFLLELLEPYRGNQLLVLIGHKPRDYKGGCKGCQRGNAARFRTLRPPGSACQHASGLLPSLSAFQQGLALADLLTSARKGGAEMLSSVHLVEGEETFQGEVGVELLDLAAVGYYDPGWTTCGDDLDAVLAQFVTGPPDQGVDSTGVAVDETAADGVWSIGGYDPRWFFFQVHAGKLGRFGD